MKTLNDIIKPLSFKGTKQTDLESVGYMQRQIDNNQITIDYNVYLSSVGINLQRPLCWSLTQKQQLILSVLKGVYIPPISIIQTMYYNREETNQPTTLYIVDGKQRLSTIFAYLNNEFAIEDLKGELVYFKDLDSKAQIVISRFHFHANIYYEWSDKKLTDLQKFEWFNLLNFSGTSFEEYHLNNLKTAFNGIEH